MGDLCVLADPGILAQMIVPEPGPEPATWPGPRQGPRRAFAAVVAAGLVGAAQQGLFASALHQHRTVLPFGVHGAWVFAAVLLLAAGAAMAALVWRRGRTSAGAGPGVGLVGGLGLAAAGLFASADAPLAHGAWFALAVVSGVALAAALTERPATNRLLGFGLGVAVGCFVPADGAWSCALAAAALAAALVFAAVAGDGDLPLGAAASWRGRIGRTLAVVAAAWFGAFAEPGAGTETVGVGLLLATAAAVWQGRTFAPWVFAGATVLLPVVRPVAALDGERVRLVARSGAVAVHYHRTDQELQLVVGGDAVDWVGPDRHEAALLATVAHALARAGDRAIAFGLGTGVAARDLRAAGRVVLDVVDDAAAAAQVRGHFDAVGPLGSNTPAAPLPRRRAALADVVGRLPSGSRQLALLPVPLRPGAAALQPEVQSGLRALVGDGFVLQVIALDRTAAGTLHQCF
ncbi:MAG: hypothetical protein JNK15_09900, partial [Planctomycetes bacterium]|nr:hypothetical protein [Planctomycetota bacterium]